MHQTAIFLIICGEWHHRHILVLINRNAGLQFGLVEHIHGAQYFLLKEAVNITLVLF
jgi:hypothetical protein